MIAYLTLEIVALAGSFIAGAYYGKKWEQKAVAEIVALKTEGQLLEGRVLQYLRIRNRVAKYL